MKSFLGNFYRHLAIFIWSHCWPFIGKYFVKTLTALRLAAHRELRHHEEQALHFAEGQQPLEDPSRRAERVSCEKKLQNTFCQLSTTRFSYHELWRAYFYPILGNTMTERVPKFPCDLWIKIFEKKYPVLTLDNNFSRPIGRA